MSAGIPLGQEIPGLRGLNNNNAMTQSMPSAGTPGGNNNIGQVYQDMGQNYQQFGQAYQQATQAADQLKNSYSVNQQQMNQYLTALQGALGGMSTANMNTGGNNPGFDPGPGIGITAPGGRPFLEQLADSSVGTPGSGLMPPRLPDNATPEQRGAYDYLYSPGAFLRDPQMAQQAQERLNASNGIGAAMTPEQYYQQYGNAVFGITPNFQG